MKAPNPAGADPLPDVPPGRFNRWGERKWIATAEPWASFVDREVSRLRLNPLGKDLCRSAMLTNSRGVEFVLFSDAQLPGPAHLLNEVLIVPCFDPMDLPAGKPGDARAMAMSHRGVFIYDGWVPVQEWTRQEIHRIVDDLDHIANLFTIYGSWFAHWEPKYSWRKPPVKFTSVEPSHLRSLTAIISVLLRLDEGDRMAVTRSAAWITAALKHDAPIQRFLLLFLSIEALATYIEREAGRGSPLTQFSTPKATPSQQADIRERCIHDVLDRLLPVDPAKAITTAYFECVVGARSLLRKHIGNIFRDSAIAERLVDATSAGPSLWDLRSDIAHGRLHLLSDREVALIEDALPTIERIAREYVRRILAGLAGVDHLPRVPRPGFMFTASHAEGREGTQYAGPTDMAEYYADVEALRTSYIRVTFD